MEASLQITAIQINEEKTKHSSNSTTEFDANLWQECDEAVTNVFHNGITHEAPAVWTRVQMFILWHFIAINTHATVTLNVIVTADHLPTLETPVDHPYINFQL